MPRTCCFHWSTTLDAVVQVSVDGSCPFRLLGRFSRRRWLFPRWCPRPKRSLLVVGLAHLAKSHLSSWFVFVWSLMNTESISFLQMTLAKLRTRTTQRTTLSTRLFMWGTCPQRQAPWRSLSSMHCFASLLSFHGRVIGPFWLRRLPRCSERPLLGVAGEAGGSPSLFPRPGGGRDRGSPRAEGQGLRFRQIQFPRRSCPRDSARECPNPLREAHQGARSSLPHPPPRTLIIYRLGRLGFHGAPMEEAWFIVPLGRVPSAVLMGEQAHAAGRELGAAAPPAAALRGAVGGRAAGVRAADGAEQDGRGGAGDAARAEPARLQASGHGNRRRREPGPLRWRVPQCDLRPAALLLMMVMTMMMMMMIEWSRVEQNLGAWCTTAGGGSWSSCLVRH